MEARLTNDPHIEVSTKLAPSHTKLGFAIPLYQNQSTGVTIQILHAI